MGSQFSKKHTSPSSYSSPPCTCKCAELKSEPDVPVRDCLDNLRREKSSHVMDKEWSTLDWSKKEAMKEEVRNVKVRNPDIDKLRILLHGPMAAGKSSFINSIDGIFQEHICSGAIAAAPTDHSFTTRYKTHYIKDGALGDYLPFVLCDTMGLEKEYAEGVLPEDIIQGLGGHIKDDYKFDPTACVSKDERGYNATPNLSDMVHCIVSIIPADTIAMIDNGILSKMRHVRRVASEKEIPQVVVMTKVDMRCPEVAKDIKLIYKSKDIEQTMQECRNTLGIPMNHIFPVKAYHDEIQLKDDLDVLLLSALTHILNIANDYATEMMRKRKAKGEKLGEMDMESGLALADSIALHQHQPFDSTRTDYTETPIKPDRNLLSIMS